MDNKPIKVLFAIVICYAKLGFIADSFYLY